MGFSNQSKRTADTNQAPRGSLPCSTGSGDHIYAADARHLSRQSPYARCLFVLLHACVFFFLARHMPLPIAFYPSVSPAGVLAVFLASPATSDPSVKKKKDAFSFLSFHTPKPSIIQGKETIHPSCGARKPAHVNLLARRRRCRRTA